MSAISINTLRAVPQIIASTAQQVTSKAADLIAEIRLGLSGPDDRISQEPGSITASASAIDKTITPTARANDPHAALERIAKRCNAIAGSPISSSADIRQAREALEQLEAENEAILDAARHLPQRVGLEIFIACLGIKLKIEGLQEQLSMPPYLY